MTEERTEKREEKKKKTIHCVCTEWLTCNRWKPHCHVCSLSFFSSTLFVLIRSSFFMHSKNKQFPYHFVFTVRSTVRSSFFLHIRFIIIFVIWRTDEYVQHNHWQDVDKSRKEDEWFLLFIFFFKKNHYRYSKRIINGKANNAMQCCNTYIYGKQSNNAIKWDMH